MEKNSAGSPLDQTIEQYKRDLMAVYRRSRTPVSPADQPPAPKPARPRPADPVPPKKEGEKAKTCEKNGGTAEKTGRTSPKAAPAPQAGACGG